MNEQKQLLDQIIFHALLGLDIAILKSHIKLAKTSEELTNTLLELTKDPIDLQMDLDAPDYPNVLAYITQTDQTDLQDISSITDGIDDHYQEVIDTYGPIDDRIQQINDAEQSYPDIPVVRTYDKRIALIPTDGNYLDVTKRILIKAIDQLLDYYPKDDKNK